MTKKQIEKAMWRWQDFMGLRNWSIVVCWKKIKSKYATSEFPSIGRTNTQPQYKLATIYFQPDRRKDIDSSVIVHELLHVVMSPLVAAAYEHNDGKIEYFNEEVTSELERIILRLRDQIKD